MTPWTAARQASLSFTTSQSLLKLMSTESVMLFNHLIFSTVPPLLLPSIFPSIRVFSNKSILHIRWLKYWSFHFSISPSNEYSGLISLVLSGLISLRCKGLSGVFSNTVVQMHQFFGAQLLKSHGPRSLVGYSPWGHKESDTTERLHFISLHFPYGPTLISIHDY